MIRELLKAGGPVPTHYFAALATQGHKMQTRMMISIERDPIERLQCNRKTKTPTTFPREGRAELLVYKHESYHLVRFEI